MNGNVTGTSETGNEMWRLFIAVPLPGAVRDAMADVQHDLRDNGWSVKWVDPTLAHITLKFLGNVDPGCVPAIERGVQSTIIAHAPIEARTGGVGAFPTVTRPRIFWLGLDGDVSPLERCASDVDQAMTMVGFQSEERSFRPHITLGRLRRGATPPREFERIAAEIKVRPIAARFDRVQLIRSIPGPAGSSYTTLAEWPLGSVELDSQTVPVELVEHG